mmetsp:Transcript_123327/g.356409  ORF Transcript_123327/g.356409 Transcript_123327/m.356409 type:complete len:284 (+) Transcript_123327:134-985(+)
MRAASTIWWVSQCLRPQLRLVHRRRPLRRGHGSLRQKERTSCLSRLDGSPRATTAHRKAAAQLAQHRVLKEAAGFDLSAAHSAFHRWRHLHKLVLPSSAPEVCTTSVLVLSSHHALRRSTARNQLLVEPPEADLLRGRRLGEILDLLVALVRDILVEQAVRLFQRLPPPCGVLSDIQLLQHALQILVPFMGSLPVDKLLVGEAHQPDAGRRGQRLLQRQQPRLQLLRLGGHTDRGLGAVSRSRDHLGAGREGVATIKLSRGLALPHNAATSASDLRRRVPHRQ